MGAVDMDHQINMNNTSATAASANPSSSQFSGYLPLYQQMSNNDHAQNNSTNMDSLAMNEYMNKMQAGASATTASSIPSATTGQAQPPVKEDQGWEEQYYKALRTIICDLATARFPLGTRPIPSLDGG